jgi:methionine-rich copper-binding protein CopC
MGSIRRQILSVLLGSFVFAAAVLGLAGPAAAHDAAESSSPAQGASVPVVPEKVSVTFSNNPLGIGSSFSIKDASGAEWADGAVEIVDNVASQKVKSGAPAGQYTVAWRVVSSDSHPIEGTFSFSAAAAAGGAATAPGTTAAATVPAIGTAQPGQTAAPDTAGSGEPFQWSIVIFAAAAVGLLVTLAVLARRRLTAGGEDER